jgi:hypothetical protein
LPERTRGSPLRTIADRFDRPGDASRGLEVGFMFTAILMVAGGLLWLWGARYLQRDTELAPTRVGVG